MLDVHPPNERIEGIRDFLLHIFTITVGLLIALGLEGCVERHQKAETRREAEHDLRQELVDNQKQLAAWRPIMQNEEKNLRLALDFLAAREEGKPFDISGVRLGYESRLLSDASWRTATATGALSLMDYEQVQSFAGLYQIQDQVADLNRQTLDDFLNLQSYTTYHFDPARITPAEAELRTTDVRRALAQS